MGVGKSGRGQEVTNSLRCDDAGTAEHVVQQRDSHDPRVVVHQSGDAGAPFPYPSHPAHTLPDPSLSQSHLGTGGPYSSLYRAIALMTLGGIIAGSIVAGAFSTYLHRTELHQQEDKYDRLDRKYDQLELKLAALEAQRQGQPLQVAEAALAKSQRTPGGTWVSTDTEPQDPASTDLEQVTRLEEKLDTIIQGRKTDAQDLAIRTSINHRLILALQEVEKKLDAERKANKNANNNTNPEQQ